MTGAASPADPRAIEALLAFWAEAGVDACLAEHPVDRLAPRAAPRPPPAPLAIPRGSDRPPPVEPTDRVARSRALAAEAQDLEALVAAARSLFGPGAVAFEGAAPARLMVVGDAPNAEDEAEGLPFRGRRGALLRALLAAAGLGEGVVYANTVFRRPPGGGDPDASAQAEAVPMLERAAALAQPRAVLLMGACAARTAAGGQGPILKLRGRWLAWPMGDGAPLPALVTLSPDFLLAHPASKKAAWGDVLSLAVRLLSEPPLP